MVDVSAVTRLTTTPDLLKPYMVPHIKLRDHANHPRQYTLTQLHGHSFSLNTQMANGNLAPSPTFPDCIATLLPFTSFSNFIFTFIHLWWNSYPSFIKQHTVNFPTKYFTLLLFPNQLFVPLVAPCQAPNPELPHREFQLVWLEFWFPSFCDYFCVIYRS